MLGDMYKQPILVALWLMALRRQPVDLGWMTGRCYTLWHA